MNILPAHLGGSEGETHVDTGTLNFIVQATGETGEIIVTANANGLKQGTIKIQTSASVLRPAVGGN